jgi:predicted MFS family arabinose efflux permease
MSGSAFGQIIGIPLGIFMAARWGFRSPFYMFAATMAVTVLLLFFGVPQPDVKRSEHPLGVRKAARDYLDMLRRPEVAWAAAAFFLMFLGVSVFVVYLPTWLERDLKFTGDQIAVMFLVGGIANVATGPQAGKLSDRVGRKGIILLACVGLSVAMLLTVPLVTNLFTAYVLFFVVMVLIAMRISPFSALLTALVRDERRGSLMSLTVALGQMGFAIGGAVAGPLFSHVGYFSNAALGAAMVLGMGLVVWLRIPEPRA